MNALVFKSISRTLAIVTATLVMTTTAFARYDDRKEPELPLKSPILQVGSSYEGVTEIGSGILTHVDALRPHAVAEYIDLYRKSQFVMTNAHLVNGKDPWVKVDGVRVKAKIVEFDAVRDAAILEIPKTEIEAAYNYSTEDGFDPTLNLNWNVYCIGPKDELDAPRDCVFNTDADQMKRIRFSAPPKRDQLQYFANSRGVVLSPSWASPGSEEGSVPKGELSWRQDPGFEIGGKNWQKRDSYYSEGRPGNTFDGKHFVIPALTSGGNSGSLVVDEELDNRFLGIPAQYNFFSRHVKVVGPEVFARMFDHYRERGGKAASTDPDKQFPRWKIKNGYSYLDFGDGTTDTDFTRATSGMGVNDPSGGQGSSAPPGGQGSSAPPGGCPGSSPDPANPADDPAILNANADVLAASEILMGKQHGIDPSEVYKLHGISPYMSKDGKRVYGFEVTDKSGKLRVIIAPNAEGYDWIKKQQADPASLYRVRPLMSPPTATELLDAKFKSQDASQNNRSQPVLGRAVVVEMPQKDPRWFDTQNNSGSYSTSSGNLRPYTVSPDGPPSETRAPEAALYHGNATVRLEEDGIHLHWKFFRNTTELKPLSKKDWEPCIIVPEDYQTIDELDLVLDKQGRPKGQKEFMPVIKVHSQKGSEFYMDLRPLLYTDLSLTYPSTEKVDWAAEKDGLPLFSKQIGLQLTTIHDATGYGKAWDERMIQFNVQERPSPVEEINCSVQR